METRIFTHKKFDNFTILSNEILQSEQMTFATKGLLSYLLSLPDTWDISATLIADKFNEKESRILSMFKELIRLGYCVRKPYHVSGKLRGQKYYISDVKGYFSDPIKNDGSVNSDPPKNQTSEISDVCKNRGTIESKEYNILESKEYNTEKDIVAPVNGELFPQEEIKPKKKEFKSLFRNSQVYLLVECNNQSGEIDYSKFIDEVTKTEKFSKTSEIDNIDYAYYFNIVSDWSDQKNMKRTRGGWLATVRNFIRGDIEKKKLKTINGSVSSMVVPGAMEYLNNDF